jgi:hypothetical protein
MDDPGAWHPISVEELRDLINGGLERMNAAQRRLWDLIKITPEKWRQFPHGAESEGFWAVALIGETVLWYNDIEEGFNRSSYREVGTIDEYFCDQDELEWAVQALLRRIETGEEVGRFGPPVTLGGDGETE